MSSWQDAKEADAGPTNGVLTLSGVTRVWKGRIEVAIERAIGKVKQTAQKAVDEVKAAARRTIGKSKEAAARAVAEAKDAG